MPGFAVVFVALAALAAVAALGVVGEFVVRNSRTSLARHESVRSYYRGRLALSH
jgi:hypothetical protein